MGLREGVYELGPDNGRLLVRTGRDGLAVKAGRCLTLEPTSWSGAARIGDAGNSAVEVRVAVDSLEVRETSGGARRLSDYDHIVIKKNLREILRADRYATIIFMSDTVSGTPEDFTIEGDLTVMGRAERLTVRAAAPDGHLVRGGATVTQSRWGIEPFSAFFGALKIADDVRVDFELALG